VLGGGLRMLTQQGDLREDGQGMDIYQLGLPTHGNPP
jgi:hypothetical protein